MKQPKGRARYLNQQIKSIKIANPFLIVIIFIILTVAIALGISIGMG